AANLEIRLDLPTLRAPPRTPPRLAGPQRARTAASRPSRARREPPVANGGQGLHSGNSPFVKASVEIPLGDGPETGEENLEADAGDSRHDDQRRDPPWHVSGWPGLRARAHAGALH